MDYRIPLRNRSKQIVEYAIVSKEDFELVNKYKWHMITVKGVHKDLKYAESTISCKKHKLHRFIFNNSNIVIPPKHVIDHINHNGLDNRRENLRIITYSLNSQNKDIQSQTKTSRFKGVSYFKESNKWKADCNGMHLGFFDSEEKAALIYDKCAFIVFGKDALTNGFSSYNDCIGKTIADIVINKSKKYTDIPKNIYFKKTQKLYFAEVIYNKIKLNIHQDIINY